MKTAFLSKDSLRNTKQISKNIVANFKAMLQPAHVVWFGCIVFFCFKRMEGVYANLAFAFVAFYVLTLLNTQGRMTRELKKKDEK